MNAMLSENTRKVVSGFAAAAFVAMSAVTFDIGHLVGAPAGTVEVGPVTPVDTVRLASAVLPEVLVTAPRAYEAPRLADTSVMPEVLVVAKRAAVQVASGTASSAKQAGSAMSVLLK
jgi:hypothetical protein